MVGSSVQQDDMTRRTFSVDEAMETKPVLLKSLANITIMSFSNFLFPSETLQTLECPT
jgi:hypothetical protein